MIAEGQNSLLNTLTFPWAPQAQVFSPCCLIRREDYVQQVWIIGSSAAMAAV